RPSPRLRCYAEGRPGHWLALCLDLDLAVQASTFPEVVKSLEKAIAQYLEHVATLPRTEQAAFLGRQAPLSLRLRFLWCALRLLRREQGGDRSGKDRAEFTLRTSREA
ncbi:hypothetical protein B2A_06730, partial [mine drainage metagenome]